MPYIDFKVVNKATIRKNNKEKETPSKQGYTYKDLKRICVYAHYYDKEQNPFYIGQGSLARAFVFNKNVRNKSWFNKAIDISKVHVKIIIIDISIEESIEKEKELIKFHGRLDNNTGCLTNENNGGKNSQIGENNYFFDKHFVGKDNPNYGNKYSSNPNSIPIIQLDILGEKVREWASATEAEEIGKFCAGSINACCNKKRHIHKGYQWIYKHDYNEKDDYEYIPGKTNNGIYIGFPMGAVNNMDKIIILYNAKQAQDLGFRLSNVNQVCHGNKKSHAGYVFKNFFDMSTYDKRKYIPYIDIDN